MALTWSAACPADLQHGTTEGTCEDMTVAFLPVPFKPARLAGAPSLPSTYMSGVVFGLAMTQATAVRW